MELSSNWFEVDNGNSKVFKNDDLRLTRLNCFSKRGVYNRL